MINLEIQSLIQDVRNSFPDKDLQVNGNDTVGAIRRLIDRRGEPITTEDADFLERLTRKVDITKRVCVSYDAGWEKPTNLTPVSSTTLLGIAFCLTRFGNPAENDSQENLLKWANSALNALDLARTSVGINQELIERVLKFIHAHLDALLHR